MVADWLSPNAKLMSRPPTGEFVRSINTISSWDDVNIKPPSESRPNDGTVTGGNVTVFEDGSKEGTSRLSAGTTRLEDPMEEDG